MDINNYIKRLRGNFKDSYGWDKLSTYLLVAGIILWSSRWTSILGLAAAGYGTWRSLSKDKYKRRLELAAFETALARVRYLVMGYSHRLEGYRKFKVFKCPQCSQKLRVPRHKGKITVTCRKCSTEFKGKS